MTGLDTLVDEQFDSLRGMRIGLVTHPAALSKTLKPASELFAAHTNLVALFGPEHGFRGEAQDLIPVTHGSGSQIPCYSLYGDTFESLKPTPDMLKGLDQLVIDMQDVGSRYYTFQATMLYCMEACEAIGLPVTVLDRPNPLGRTVEGPTIRPGFESFVGPHQTSIRHGLSMAELAEFYHRERTPKLFLSTLGTASDWPSGRPWFPPSPNMPTIDTAIVYPGGCLYEGTNLSEGRGTTRPFEYVGHPAIDPQRLVDELAKFELPGVTFIPCSFRPTFQKHAGKSCGGCFIVPTDHETFQPVRTGLAVIMASRKLLGSQFAWRTERYEFVEHIPAIDLLFGSDRERLAIEAGQSFAEIVGAWESEEAEFRQIQEEIIG